MALKKDKAKVIDEHLDDGKLAAFLQFTPPNGVDADYHILEKAYRGLTAPLFDRFLDLFAAQNLNLQATNPRGQTIHDVVSSHGQSSEYLKVISSHA